MDKELHRVVSESILRYAVIENHKREMAEIPSNEEMAELYTFSKRHEKRMNALFRKEKLKELSRVVLIIGRRVAVIFIFAAIVLFGMLMTDSGVRAAVRQTIIEWHEKFTRFNYTETKQIDKFQEWYPTYLPGDFKEQSKSFSGGLVSIEFTNKKDENIIFEYSQAGGFSMNVDNENSEYELISADGIEYHVFKSISIDFMSMVVWQEGDYRFYLKSFIDSKYLIEIAASVSAHITN